MRAGWWALAVGLVLGGGLALALTGPVAPRAGGRGPVQETLDLDRGPELDARRAAAVAAATERCLAALGIEADIRPEPPPPIPDAVLDPVAWAERWGFGITTRPDVPASVVETAPLDADGLRCHEAATAEIYGLRERLLAPLRPGLVELGATIDADPASLAADATWVTCSRAATVALEPALPAPTAPGQLDAVRAWFVARGGRQDRSTTALERRVAAAIARCDLERAEARLVAAVPFERAYVRRHRDELRRIGAAIRAIEADYPAAAAP